MCFFVYTMGVYINKACNKYKYSLFTIKVMFLN